jgi:hypothetical protein
MSIIPHHKYSNNNIFLESSDVCLNHRSVSNQSSGVRALYSFGTRVGKANCCSSGMAAEIPLIKTSRAADKERALFVFRFSHPDNRFRPSSIVVCAPDTFVAKVGSRRE